MHPIYFTELEEDAHTQKCKFPAHLMSYLECNIGDYIIIKYGTNEIVCQVFPFLSCNNILKVGKAVSSTITEEKHVKNYSFLQISDFKKLSPVFVEYIKVEIVLTSVKSLAKWNDSYKNTVWTLEILSQYSIINSCVINCTGHPLANDIHHINVLEAFITSEHVGKLSTSTKVEISRVLCVEQYNQLLEFKNIEISGQDDVISYMKALIMHPNIHPRSYKFALGLLMVGPQGCGKTCIVKKLAFECKAYLKIIDGAHLVNMSSDDAKDYFVQLLENINACNWKPYILLFDNIDTLSSIGNKSNMSSYILEFLDKIKLQNIFVIGTTAVTNILLPGLRNLGFFKKEIHIGVPTYEQREDILKGLIPHVELNPNLDLCVIAKKTAGYVGADIIALYIEAQAIQRKKSMENGPEILANDISTKDFEKALLVVKSSIMRNSTETWNLNVKPVHWDDIAGMESIKKRVQMSIEWPLLHPHAFFKVGLPCPRGILLFGPPGCCKTTIVRALATECNATFFSASPAQIYSSCVGDSEQAILKLFHQARQFAPSIIFFDELDSLVGKRDFGSGSRNIHEKVLSALLNEMDGIGIKRESLQGTVKTKLFKGNCMESQKFSARRNFNQNVVVVGATNRPDKIDDALLRPGRFDTILYVPLPNEKMRESILKHFTKKMNLPNADAIWLAQNTERFSVADLKNLCNAAGQNAVRNDFSLNCISKKHFEDELKKIQPSISEVQLRTYEHFSSKYGH